MSLRPFQGYRPHKRTPTATIARGVERRFQIADEIRERADYGACPGDQHVIGFRTSATGKNDSRGGARGPLCGDGRVARPGAAPR